MGKIFSKLSPRAIRVLHSALAIVVLTITTINFSHNMVIHRTSNDQCGWRLVGKSMMLVSDVMPGGVADRAGIKNGDTLIAIAGRPFVTEGEAQQRIDSLQHHDSVQYTVLREGKIFTTNVELVKLFNFVYLANFLLGLSFLIVGYVVVMTRPHGNIQRKFARYTLTTMLFFGLTNLRVNNTDPQWMGPLLGMSLLVAFLLAPATFIGFYFDFPIQRKLKYRKHLTATIYILALLCTLTIALNGRFFSLPGFILRILFVFPPASFVIGLTLFVDSYHRFLTVQQRKPFKPILYAVLIGSATIIYNYVINSVYPFSLYVNPLVLFPNLLLIGVPVVFGYSIFKYKLMDFDFIIKRSLSYAIITTTLAAVYLSFIFGLGSILGKALGESENKILTVIVFLIVAFLFDPFKQRVQHWIDRVFYYERYNYQKALLEFSQELPRQLEMEQIFNSILHRIADTMHVKSIAVLLCDENEGCHNATYGFSPECCDFDQSADGLIALLRETKKPRLIDPSDEIEMSKFNEGDRRRMINAEIVLAVPMTIQDRLIGVILAGRKLSDRAYSQEDLDLLSTVANQGAIAIENARLHKSEIEKQKIQEELAIARRIQDGLLPKETPHLGNLEISGFSLPALDVGGDYYDFIRIDEHKLLVIVADVSGKGMSAAIYMSKIQGMIQFAASIYSSPKEILMQVNRRIYDGIERKSFITMIAALFDVQKKEVTICRAGHNKAIIRKNGMLGFLDGVGLGLGLERGPLFESSLEEVKASLTAESLFVFYTDGLTEAMNRKRAEFGEESVLQIVRDNLHASAEDIRQSIVQAVSDFRGGAEQNDDLTLVIVKSKN
jgi:serine phosphatase RsbU (regulator of sigma subunit)